MFTLLLLDGFNRFRGDRGDAALFHILTGKKSAQTIQDVFSYQFEGYYGLLPQLPRATYVKYMKQLLLKKHIERLDDETIKLTNSGMLYLQKNSTIRNSLNYFRGIDENESARVLFNRMSLLIQLYSNSKLGTKRYTPIIDHMPTQIRVKQYYSMNKGQFDCIMQVLYEDLVQSLEQLETPFADVFVLRLTGSHRVGWSKLQLSKKFGCSTVDIELYLLYSTQFVIAHTSETSPLHDWAPVNKKTSLVTNSSEVTLELYEKGFSVEEICELRGFKVSTIQDHLVEMAYAMPNFSILPFVDKDKIRYIQQVIKNQNIKRLRKIKENCPDEITYFQIRLVLAKTTKGVGL